LKIFITGATGFVGGYLRKYLESPEHCVWGAAYPEVPQGFPDEKIFYLDIRSEGDVFRHIREIQPDWVFHLAAVSNVRNAWNVRRQTLETNIIGTLNVLEGIRQFSPKARIIFISSSDIYGTSPLSGNPITEREEILTMNPYAYSKWSGEVLCDFYTRVESMDIVVARPFPHTGPGQSADFVCSDWACQIARIEKGLKEPEIYVGNISVERDYTDVRDVVVAYVNLIEKGKIGEVYNVCSGRSYSLEKILDFYLSIANKKVSVRIDTQKLRKADIPRLVGDNRKIKEEVSWEPKIPLEQSLQELLAYWRQNI
jgi:GDP-4-dehydro-6-deoxy-D-mannose reductase